MKKVGSYDQYSEVFDSDGITVLHESNGSNIVHASDLTESEAIDYAKTVFESSKSLGTYEEVIVREETGYYEIKIEFPDKKKLHRVIYVY